MEVDWKAIIPYICVVAMAIALVTIDQRGNDARIEQIAREGAVREDQFCLLTERDHRQDVRTLRETYEYFLKLTPAELKQTINQVILSNVPKTETEAKTDSAPEVCDEPGKYGDKNVGLPEPDPKVPKRPKELDTLLEGQIGG